MPLEDAAAAATADAVAGTTDANATTETAAAADGAEEAFAKRAHVHCRLMDSAILAMRGDDIPKSFELSLHSPWNLFLVDSTVPKEDDELPDYLDLRHLQNQNWADIQWQRGCDALQRGDRALAMQAFQQGLDLVPDHAPIQHSLQSMSMVPHKQPELSQQPPRKSALAAKFERSRQDAILEQSFGANTMVTSSADPLYPYLQDDEDDDSGAVKDRKKRRSKDRKKKRKREKRRRKHRRRRSESSLSSEEEESSSRYRKRRKKSRSSSDRHYEESSVDSSGRYRKRRRRDKSISSDSPDEDDSFSSSNRPRKRRRSPDRVRRHERDSERRHGKVSSKTRKGDRDDTEGSSNESLRGRIDDSDIQHQQQQHTTEESTNRTRNDARSPKQQVALEYHNGHDVEDRFRGSQRETISRNVQHSSDAERHDRRTRHHDDDDDSDSSRLLQSVDHRRRRQSDDISLSSSEMTADSLSIIRRRRRVRQRGGKRPR